MFLPFEKAKNSIKSAPFLYKSLLPIVRRLRRRGGEAERLRQYCFQVPNVVAEPMFVKVGANDGVTGDPVSDILLANQKWRGLLIEPVPFIFQRLQKNFGDNRRFVLEQAAIGANPGKTAFYYVDARAIDSIPELPDWYDQLGSFDRSHIVRQMDGILTPFILECAVEVRPLTDVLKKNAIREVHLLHIDTEGYDYEVVKTADLTHQPPAAILLEYKHLSQNHRIELLALLRRHGYLVDDCCGDYFAIHNNSPLSHLARDWAMRARK